jgi:DNA-binding NarL/FixJ family response regulator
MSSDSVRVLIADDHRMFREALRLVLSAEPGIEVVGEAGTSDETMQLVSSVKADVLLLDLSMPGGGGIGVLNKLASLQSRIYPIVVTASTDRQEIVQAIRLGARGVVVKDAPSEILVKSIRQVAAGDRWIGHERVGEVLESLRGGRKPAQASRRPIESLTKRERDIVSAVLQGATNKDVSRQFGLSESTVKNHLTHIFDKLGVANRLELALFAVHHHLLDTPQGS